MWGTFFIAIVVAFLCTYLPGYFLIRSLKVTHLVSLVCAPVITVVAYAVLSIAYAKMNIFTTWELLFIPPLVLGVLAFLVSCFVGRGKSVDFGLGRASHTSGGFDWKCLALYVGVGVAITLFVLVGSLDGPDSFVQDFDNVHHLGSIRGFIESGNWSPLEVSLYPLATQAAFNPLPGTEFYPSAWHCTAAMLVSALDVSIPLAQNATNFLFTAIVFPSTVFLLMRRLFGDMPRVIIFGAFCTLAFSAFPWGFLFFGPLYSNLSSFAVLSAVAFFFISIFSQRVSVSSRVIAGSLFLIGILSLAFTQPNAVFTMGVFLIPFCVYQVSRIADYVHVADKRRLLVQALLCVSFLVLVALLWFALFNAPFMQKVVTHDWPSSLSKIWAIIKAVLLAFNVPAFELVLAALVLIGIFYTLRKRQWFWISCSFVLIIALFVVDTSFDGYIKFLLTGFWYTDSYRVAASVVFPGIPLASLGLFAVCSAVGTRLARLSERKGGAKPCLWIVPCTVLVLFVVTTFYPRCFILPSAYELHTAFGVVTERLTYLNDSTRANIYGSNERAFVEEVLQILPEDSVVINEPNDGSAFAFGVDGLPTYYRNLRTYGKDNETVDSKVIRQHLAAIATNDQVQQAVKHCGAHYLLLLDQGDDQEKEPYPFTYRAEDWSGINAVRDDTPGFEVILSNGDMRLYRIVTSGEQSSVHH